MLTHPSYTSFRPPELICLLWECPFSSSTPLLSFSFLHFICFVPRISRCFLFITAHSYFMFQMSLLPFLEILIRLIFNFSSSGFSVYCLSGSVCSAEVVISPLSVHVPLGISVCVGSDVSLRERRWLRPWGREWTSGWQSLVLQLGINHSYCHPSPLPHPGMVTFREPWELLFSKSYPSLLWDWGMWRGNIRAWLASLYLLLPQKGSNSAPVSPNCLCWVLGWGGALPLKQHGSILHWGQGGRKKRYTQPGLPNTSLTCGLGLLSPTLSFSFYTGTQPPCLPVLFSWFWW